MFGWLNHREQATALWIALFLAWATSRADVRDSARQVLRTLFGTKIIGVVMAAALYSAGVVWCLWKAGVWNGSLLKETVYWFAASALVTVFRLPGKDGRFFRQFAREGLTVAAVLAFLVNVYVFPLYVEVFFVPALLCVVVVAAFSETRAEYAPAAKLLGGVQAAVGWTLFAYVALRIAVALHHFLSWETLQGFLIAPVLSVAFVPFAYVFAVVMAYELIFVRLGFALKNDYGSMPLPLRLKFATVRAAGLRLARVNAFSPAVMPQAFMGDSEEDVLRAIESFREAAA